MRKPALPPLSRKEHSRKGQQVGTKFWKQPCAWHGQGTATAEKRCGRSAENGGVRGRGAPGEHGWARPAPRELDFTLHHREVPGSSDETFALTGPVPGSRTEAGAMVRGLVQRYAGQHGPQRSPLSLGVLRALR